MSLPEFVPLNRETCPPQWLESAEIVELNGFVVLDGFLCAVRLILALVVVLIGIRACRASRRSLQSEHTASIENRCYLLFLLATVLIGLNVASWPILYLVLQSYVREWPSIMCIYGVTKIGSGTIGASRFLPLLLSGLLWTKPLMVFLSGAGYVLYLINRRTQSAPLVYRVLLLLLLTGAVTVVDSLFECAYLAIPKTEIHVAGGCCTTTLEAVQRTSQFTTPRIHVREPQRPLLIAAYYSLSLAMVLGLAASVLWMQQPSGFRKWLLCVGAVISIPVSTLFLVEIAAPAILRLPFHHCPYDLVSAAPESLTAVFLFLLGCFSVGWSCVAGTIGDCDQTHGFLGEFMARLQFFAMFGYAGSTLLISIELLLA